MITSPDLEHRLQGLYDEFLELNDLDGSADDLLMDEKIKLDGGQRSFLAAFSLLWDSVYG